jgi:hypothetical protein
LWHVCPTIGNILLAAVKFLSQMFKEDITRSFHFGAKVKFLKKDKIHPDLVDKEFCLIGFDDTAFALIEWSKRGGYNFEFYTGSVYSYLELVA